jgi:hypothetical protein
MVLPATVKAGQVAFDWCYQFIRPVPKKTGEAWTAGQTVVANATNGNFEKTTSQKQVGKKGIVIYDALSADDIGTIAFAPAIIYSQYLPAAALKNFSLVQTSATVGGWEAKTADAAYADLIHTVAFAQVMGKAGQGMGSGQGFNDFTDIAQNEIVRLQLQ